MNGGKFVDLVKKLKNIPQPAKPWVWWHWINGNVSKEGITADLKDICEKGFGGVQMFDVSLYAPNGPVRYGTEAWFDHMLHAVKEAEKNCLEFGMMNGPGWSLSGGPWVKPHQSMKHLVFSEVNLEGGKLIATNLPQPGCVEGFYKDVAVLAIPFEVAAHASPIENLDSKLGNNKINMQGHFEKNLAEVRAIDSRKIIDISRYFSRGALKWEAPPGNHLVIRFGYTSTGKKNHPAVPEGHGLEIDKFSRRHVTHHWNHAVKPLLDKVKKHGFKSFTNILCDSWEAGTQTWTESFETLFYKHNKYSLTKFLVCFTGRYVESGDKTEAFLNDLRKTYGMLYATAYYQTLQKLCKKKGLDLYAEVYGGVLDEFYGAEQADIPMTEFWMNDICDCNHTVPGLAHTTGKTIVAAEAFTSRPPDGLWKDFPQNFKEIGDKIFTLGINRLHLHSYIHQPKSDLAPGFSHGRYGTQFGRLNTWWPHSKPWVDYLSQTQYLLQQGRAVCDGLLLRPDDLDYDTRGVHPDVSPFGLKGEYIALRQLLQARAKNGQIITKNGLSYGFLVFPFQWNGSFRLLKKLQYFLKNKVLVFADLPARGSGYLDLISPIKSRWNQAKESIWGGSFQTIFSVHDMGRVLKERNVYPNIRMKEGPLDQNLLHTQRKGLDWNGYFLSNITGKTLSCELEFDHVGKKAYLYDPLHSEMRALEGVRDSGRTRLRLEFPKGGSKFVFFHQGPFHIPETLAGPLNKASGEKSVKAPALLSGLQIEGPWELSLLSSYESPGHVSLERLVDLSDHPDENIRFFSGMLAYSTVFQIDPSDLRGKQFTLSLGGLCSTAKITLNGEVVGLLWTDPFEIDISPGVKPGANILEIEVPNSWQNRLIGDVVLFGDDEYSKNETVFTTGRLLNFPDWYQNPSKIETRKKKAFTLWNHFSKESQLPQSGILGPINVNIYGHP